MFQTCMTLFFEHIALHTYVLFTIDFHGIEGEKKGNIWNHRKKKSDSFKMTWGWVNNDILLILGLKALHTEHVLAINWNGKQNTFF